MSNYCLLAENSYIKMVSVGHQSAAAFTFGLPPNTSDLASNESTIRLSFIQFFFNLWDCEKITAHTFVGLRKVLSAFAHLTDHVTFALNQLVYIVRFYSQ